MQTIQIAATRERFANTRRMDAWWLAPLFANAAGQLRAARSRKVSKRKRPPGALCRGRMASEARAKV